MQHLQLKNSVKHQEDLMRIKNFRLIDNDFMTICFEDSIECVELVLRIILDKPDLKVTEVHTQRFLKNLTKRSVQLDIYAVDASDIRYNIEIQRDDKGAGVKRARYNSSVLDTRILPSGDDTDNLTETYVIFITENDVIGKGMPVYPVERYILNTGELFGDGSHILYVNGEYREDTPVGRLMHDFFCTNPDDMYYKVLADRVRYFKENKKGVAMMCKAMEEMCNKAKEENKMQIALNMIREGILTLEKIAEYCELTIEEVQELKTNI